LRLLNDEPFTGTPATITVEATDGTGTEAADGSPDFTFTFTRTGDTSQALSVNYNVMSGGVNWASPGQDINTAYSGIVLFEAGSATATLTFDAINDLQVENTESFTVSISPDFDYMNPSYVPSYVVGAQSSATGTVVDNDSGALPSVSISDAAAVSEGGVLSFTLTRTGGGTNTSNRAVTLRSRSITIGSTNLAGGKHLPRASRRLWSHGDMKTT